MKLTALKIKQLLDSKTVQTLADGGGLSLAILPTGSPVWRYRFRFGWQDEAKGKRKALMLSLGAYPEVSLKEAREKHAEARALLRQGINPAGVRRDARAAQKVAAANSFEGVARAWMKEHRADRAAATRTKDEWLLGFAFKAFGAMPINAVKPAIILRVLKDLQAREVLETAHRVRSRCSLVFRYAVIHGLADSDPAAALCGALPSAKVTNRAAITDPNAIPALLKALDGYGGQPSTVAALRLAPLVFVRPGELRTMEWKHIDWEAHEWNIPAELMKMDKPHVVPLSDQAIAILKAHHALTGRRSHAFPSMTNPRRCLSENTVNAALRKLGFDKETMTGHGFRAMASTRLNELGFDHDVIERQLGML